MRITIVATSARWLAESCSRAGWHADAIDLFGDQDLRKCCQVRQVCDLNQALALSQPGNVPFLFGPGFETLVFSRPEAMVESQTLNTSIESVFRCRDVEHWSGLVKQAGHIVPEYCFHKPEIPVGNQVWLVKPVVGAGGLGISRHNPGNPVAIGPAEFLQEYVPGMAASLVAVADGQSARMLGCFRQIVGDRAFGVAGDFCFVGSIGPVFFPEQIQAELESILNVIVKGCGLRGIIGVDFVVRNDRPVAIEINPRPSASCELLEIKTGISLLPLHVRALRGQLKGSNDFQARRRKTSKCVGKASVFWNQPVCVTAEPGFHDWLVQEHSAGQAADIPMASSSIQPGSPIATVLASASSPDLVLDLLRKRSTELLERLAVSQQNSRE